MCRVTYGLTLTVGTALPTVTYKLTRPLQKHLKK